MKSLSKELGMEDGETVSPGRRALPAPEVRTAVKLSSSVKKRESCVPLQYPELGRCTAGRTYEGEGEAVAVFSTTGVVMLSFALVFPHIAGRADGQREQCRGGF